MDGTRDRPPGKAAENWGRRDGIRAGAVSGPWRSAPRAPSDGQPERHPQAPSSQLHQPVGQQASQPYAKGDPSGHRDLDLGRARTRRAMGSVGWITFGAVVAVACIIAAVVMRPDPGPVSAPDAVVETASPSVPVSAVPGTAPVVSDPEIDRAGVSAGGMPDPEASAPQPADPMLAGVSVVRLRVGPGFDADRQAAIVAALARAGVPSVKVESLPFKIATSRVGYYRAEDLRAARQLGKLISPVIAGGSEVGVRDYGQLLADPEPGRLDLWVGD